MLQQFPEHSKIFPMFNAIVLGLFLFLLPSAHAQEATLLGEKNTSLKVERVIDTTTIVLKNGQKIHLQGLESFAPPPKKYREMGERGQLIDPPEVTEPTTSLEEQAFTFAQRLLENQKIRLEYDVETVDSNGRRLAYVFLLDGTLANAELLRQGFVRMTIRPPNVKYAEKLREAYQEARREQRAYLAD